MTTTQPEPRRFRPARVTRPDAGGYLCAPVDQHGRESGDTPTYDYDAVVRRCVQLNKAREARVKP
jgi:hypothetical protein